MSQDRSTPIASDERAVADVVGTSLLVATTVTVAAGLGAVMLGALPGPDPPPGFDLAAMLEATCPWGDGNDHLVLEHRGGEAVHPAGIVVILTTGGSAQELAGTIWVEGGDLDGLFEIGERWASPGVTLVEGDMVAIDIVAAGEARVVYSTTLRVDPSACGGSP